MTNYKPLSTVLETYYAQPFEQLPHDLQEQVDDAFFPLSWSALSPEQRRFAAERWDYQNDPAFEAKRQESAAWADKLFEVKRQIARWESVATPTAQDMAAQGQALSRLSARLVELKREWRETPCDSAPVEVVEARIHRSEQKTLLRIIHAFAQLSGVGPIKTRVDGDGWRKSADVLLQRLADKGVEAPSDTKTLAKHLRECFDPLLR